MWVAGAEVCRQIVYPVDVENRKRVDRAARRTAKSSMSKERDCTAVFLASLLPIAKSSRGADEGVDYKSLKLMEWQQLVGIVCAMRTQYPIAKAVPAPNKLRRRWLFRVVHLDRIVINVDDNDGGLAASMIGVRTCRSEWNCLVCVHKLEKVHA